MSLKTFVKVGEITNLSDARYCAGMGVDLLGFNVVENTSGYVDPDKFQEIAGWVVGVSNFLPNDELLDSLKNAGISFVESASKEVLLNLNSFERIYKVEIETKENMSSLVDQLEELSSFADYLLLGSKNEALFNDLDQLSAKVSGMKVKLIKAYELDTAKIAQLDQSNYHGIALKGSEEIKPGYKDFDELSDILELLEVD